ncbi:LysR family transcriptional regulator [Rhizobium sp. FY34]|uniref:LysR family transcriptional regulator n=1 Tax=Rhizobium sp. FY34 TaxID=2562309 RepID=UPI0010C0D5C7|nr:LysR family transcriptional regulator [Rhizobium sp. FY34]
MNNPDWNLYRTLLAVLQTGSLSAAARKLGLTQPTVGRHVDELEAALGYPLFTRSQQGLMPTEAALALQPYAQTLSSTVAALLREASGTLGAVDGVVRISASDIIGIEVLAPILAKLQAEHPHLIIELSLSDTVEDLLRREADIAVRMTEPRQDALVARHIGDIELGLHAQRDYLERNGYPADLAALAHHRMIGFDRETAFIRASLDHIRRVAPDFPTDITRSYRCDSNLAQLSAIRAGAGIGICQVKLAARDQGLVRLLPEFSLPLETWVAMHENLKQSRRCRTVFDALCKGLLEYTRGRPDHQL